MNVINTRQRPLIAFFDYPDVFEDFYPHYGVDQQNFATHWAATGNHLYLKVLQCDVGDVVWYTFSLAPEFTEARHEVVGCRVKMLTSSLLHRCLWRAFYLPRMAWRWRFAYRAYATVASYIALVSRSFIRALKNDQPDIFFVQDYSSGRFDVLILVARILGVPLIAYHSGSRPEGYIGRLAKHWTIPHADMLIASSQAEVEMLASRYCVPRDRITVILTPIDTNIYYPMDRKAACKAAGINPEWRYLLFMGRLDDNVKRVSALIRAFATLATKHRDVDLLIAGDGPDREKLQRLSDKCAPDRIRFLGWISGVEAKAQLYNVAECLVLPSRSEGFPTVVGEAMSCGTPVLASQVGGVGEMVVEGQTGWLIPPGDDDAFSVRLAFVLDHPEVVASMRQPARQMAESRVSQAAVAAELRKCFSFVGEHLG